MKNFIFDAKNVETSASTAYNLRVELDTSYPNEVLDHFEPQEIIDNYSTSKLDDLYNLLKEYYGDNDDV